MPREMASNGEVSYSVTNLDSALTMLMAIFVYGEEVVKDNKQIALGNTTEEEEEEEDEEEEEEVGGGGGAGAGEGEEEEEEEEKDFFYVKGPLLTHHC
ncbi:hypothetical protein ElyMa_005255100 [Elysia marginata]|uniref:Uncharacterized protein n=1 Tax=Elysia marginata TaxID=1093978 RepID=A0AAV4K122_9GAST|nr:hypothetical protein ElyMa_005255100 [Elysia marginata]